MSAVTSAVAAGALGCYTPVSADYVRAHQGLSVSVELGPSGEFSVDLTRARIADDTLVGTIESCTPPPIPAPESFECPRLGTEARIPMGQVRRLQIHKVTSGAVIAGVIVGTAAIAFATILATRPGPSPQPPPPSATGFGLSCPQVDSFDGTRWTLDSGTFGGAIFEAAQRTDYDLLEHLAPVGGTYHLTLSDRADETEHTDALAIEVIDHAAGVRVVPANDGRLLTFAAPVRPTAAQDLRSANALPAIVNLDESYWRSDLSGRRADDPAQVRDGLELTFPKPRDAARVKLLVSGMNTPWSAGLVLRFLASLGPGIGDWYARMNGDPSARARFTEFLLREAMLRVDVWTGSGWSSRGVFWEAGPEVRKQQAMAFDVRDVTGSELRVRLHSPVGFWAIDEVAVDYGADVPLRAQVIKARSATTQDGRDVRATLEATDGLRYRMVKGDWAKLLFDAPPPLGAGWDRSFVLVTTGYYVVDVKPDPRGSPAVVDALLSTPGLLARESLTELEWTVAREILQ
jgi:hypothetical protein